MEGTFSAIGLDVDVTASTREVPTWVYQQIVAVRMPHPEATAQCAQYLPHLPGLEVLIIGGADFGDQQLLEPGAAAGRELSPP